MDSREQREYGPVRIDPDMAKQVKAKAALEGISMKEWVERAIKEYTERHPEKR